MKSIKYLKTLKAAQQAVNDILVKEKPVIGVKCLGCNVGEHGGRITLVAVSCWDGNIYIFDVIKDSMMYESGLLRLFQSIELLKVFHDCSNDSAGLQKQFRIKLNNVFDTQVAHSIILERKGLSPRLLSYEKLCDEYHHQLHEPTQEFQRLLVEDINVWARRPVTHEMKLVASSSVKPLVPGLFIETDKLLPPDTDDWFLHRCKEIRLSRLTPSRFKCGEKIKCSRDHSSGVKHLFGTHFCSCPTCVDEMGTALTYLKTRTYMS
ncbi:hypothetical protein ACF0H5_012778 [Mactra antiquata]